MIITVIITLSEPCTLWSISVPGSKADNCQRPLHFKHRSAKSIKESAYKEAAGQLKTNSSSTQSILIFNYNFLNSRTYKTAVVYCTYLENNTNKILFTSEHRRAFLSGTLIPAEPGRISRIKWSFVFSLYLLHTASTNSWIVVIGVTWILVSTFKLKQDFELTHHLMEQIYTSQNYCA